MNIVISLRMKNPVCLFWKKLESFSEHCDAYLQSEHEESHDDELKDVYFAVNAYIRIADYYDEHFVTLIQKDANNVIVKQFCMNPRHPLQNIMKKDAVQSYFQQRCHLLIIIWSF